MDDDRIRVPVIEFLISFYRSSNEILDLGSPDAMYVCLAVGYLSAEKTPATISKISDLIGLSRDKVRRLLRILEEKGIVESHSGMHGKVFVRGPAIRDRYDLMHDSILMFYETAAKVWGCHTSELVEQHK